MKNHLSLCGLALAFAWASQAEANSITSQTWAVGAAIPQGSPVGLTASGTFNGIPAASIFDVDVALNITGGYNGGLYGYLVLQNPSGATATEILLNEIGTSSSNPFGSAGAGMNVVLSDSGTVNGSIHNAPGMPAGVWLPDSANTLDGTFGGLSPNGTWTLFLADEFAGGGTSTLQSWGLTVTSPDGSATWAAAGVWGALAVVAARMQRRKMLA